MLQQGSYPTHATSATNAARWHGVFPIISRTVYGAFLLDQMRRLGQLRCYGSKELVRREKWEADPPLDGTACGRVDMWTFGQVVVIRHPTFDMLRRVFGRQ